MAPPQRPESLRNPARDQQHGRHGNSFTSTARGHNGSSHRRGENLERRGHSDGDLVANGMRAPPRHRQGSGFDAAAWTELLNHSSAVVDQGPENYDISARRRAMMVEDRRRRLSEHMDGQARRRYSSERGTHRAFPPSRQDAGRPLNRPLPFGPLQGTAESTAASSVSSGRSPISDGDSRQHGSSREIKLPVWQPDEEISNCPICGNAFTFWYRKHHCRKCGRVVCANCSPHRITIPRQFIVHPPDASPASPEIKKRNGIDVVDLTGDDDQQPQTSQRPMSSDYRIDPALGGGQEVRLCNPCVPDPNPLPHMHPYVPSPRAYPQRNAPGSTGQGEERISGVQGWQTLDTLPSLTTRSHFPSPSQHSDRRATFQTESSPFGPSSSRPVNQTARSSAHAMAPPQMPTAYGSAPDQASQQRYLEGLLQRDASQHHRHHASVGRIPTTSRTFHIPDLQPPARRAPPPTPRPQLREEDECPICHGALPAKGPDGSETAREVHVTGCIESHFSSSTPHASHPPATAATEAATAASAATPAQSSGRPLTFVINRRHGSQNASSGTSPSAIRPRRRTTGMVIYNATEKDCVGENGEGEAECVICFEEFAVGDEMGRLECLCKFHRQCIRQWWDTKGPGACPVHQEGN